MTTPAGAPDRRRLARAFAASVAIVSVSVAGWRVVRTLHALPSGIDPDGNLIERDGPPPRRPLAAWLAKAPGSSVLAKELGGDEVLDVLRAPERGVAFRVRVYDRPPDQALVLAGPVVISPELLARFSSSLGSAASYSRPYRKARDGECTPRPGIGWLPYYLVKLRLERGASKVDVFIAPDPDVHVERENVEVGHALLHHPVILKHLDLAEALFPDDVEIKQIKAQVLQAHRAPATSAVVLPGQP